MRLYYNFVLYILNIINHDYFQAISVFFIYFNCFSIFQETLDVVWADIHWFFFVLQDYWLELIGLK